MPQALPERVLTGKRPAAVQAPILPALNDGASLAGQGDRRPSAALRHPLQGGDGEPFSILAEAELLSTEGVSPDARIFQTITAIIAVGAFGRRTLFLTHDFELVGSLALFGIGSDFKETFYVSGFSEAFLCDHSATGGGEIEVLDWLSGESVDVNIDDPRLADVVRYMSSQD